MKKLFLPFITMAATAIILTACSTNTAQPAAVSTTSQPDVMIAEGRLLPVNSMDQSFSIPGQAAEVLVIDGENVKEGQVLARLRTSPDLQLALARAQLEALAAQQALDGLKAAAEVSLTQGRLSVIAAQNQLEAAQDQYVDDATAEKKAALEAAEAFLNQARDAQENLETGKGVDPDQLAAAEARLASAKAAVASAQAAMEALELKATMDGTLVGMDLQAGQRISAGQPVVTLADFTSWVVKTDNLTEDEVVGLEIGQRVEVVLDALPDVTLTGEVTHINTRYEEKRGDITYTVTVTLQQADPAMRWGMTAAVKFQP
jgi:HlyD family secretion protein